MHRDSPAEARLALLTDARFGAHVPPGFHPERPERLAAAQRGAARVTSGRRVAVATREALREELERVHRSDYLDRLQRLLAGAPGYLDADTYYGAGTREAAWLAAGSACALVEALQSAAADVGALLARPPGHHAGRDRAMGFCLLNNVAVAAAHARARGAGRVAIVNWDVHHGNGTQDIFEADPAVLFISLHESPLYPETGHVDEVGSGAAAGMTVDIPLPSGSDGGTYAMAFERLVLPVLARAGADLLLISAGFDAHARDPLAGMQLDELAYGWMASRLRELGAPVGLVLEGGYDLTALEHGVHAALAGLVEPVETAALAARATPAGEAAISAALAAQRPWWPGAL